MEAWDDRGIDSEGDRLTPPGTEAKRRIEINKNACPPVVTGWSDKVQTGSEGPDLRSTSAAVFSMRRTIFLMLAVVLAVVLAQLAPAQAQCSSSCDTCDYDQAAAGASVSSACQSGGTGGRYCCSNCQCGQWTWNYVYVCSTCSSYSSSSSSRRRSSSYSSSSDSSSTYSSGTLDTDAGEQLAENTADAVCSAIADYGCKLAPECCGFVSRSTFPLVSAR
jgi:hypothetical protein